MTHSESATRLTKRSGPLATLLKCVPLLVVLILPDVPTPDEAYAAIDYGYALLAAFGAAGAFGYLVIRLASPLDFPPIPGGLGFSQAPEAVGNPRGENWPLLVALVFGSVVLLLAGLGGWVYSPAR